MDQISSELKDGAHHHGISRPPDKLVESDPEPPSPSSTPDTVADLEKPGNPYTPANAYPYALRRTESGVSVERAQVEFAELSKELSVHSEKRRKLSQSQSHHSGLRPQDVEKSGTGSDDSLEEERWDLEQTLRGSKEQDYASGIKSKRVGVIWDKLTVSGIGGVKNFIKTFPQAFVSFFNVPETLMHLFGYGKKGREFEILQNFRGVVRPGEMVLVLGRPGSGCTTFLKVIANQRFGFTNVAGEVLYGPYDSKTFAKKYRGEAVYNLEDDIHHPTLTVGQTLGFALDVKTPGKRPGGMSKAEFKEKVIHLLLKMFNIEHTLNTIVGNPFVRGISGGERKRVSIAEMMVTSACICAWDNTTRGLDASTALDYAKSLRIMTNIYKTTTFVSLYQASENIYNQFDKVMVIDEGRQVFFGPVREARAYFESLGFKEKPRQTTPDYLTGCTDPFEREYKDGMSETNAPSTADSLVKAFNESRFSTSLSEDMNIYRQQIKNEETAFREFEIAHREAKRRGTSKSSVYATPFYLQVWALMQRQFLIKWQDKFSLVVSWITSITIAIVLVSSIMAKTKLVIFTSYREPFG